MGKIGKSHQKKDYAVSMQCMCECDICCAGFREGTVDSQTQNDDSEGKLHVYHCRCDVKIRRNEVILYAQGQPRRLTEQGILSSTYISLAMQTIHFLLKNIVLLVKASRYGKEFSHWWRR